MSMQAASLEVLEKANLPAPQARAIVQAIEIEITGAQNVLATKQDVKHEITLLRQDLKQEVTVLRQDMAEQRHELSMKIEGLRGDLRTEIQASAKELTRSFHTSLLTALAGQMGILLGIAYFFVTHLKP